MREIEYQLCDVFTTKALQGNQLAVFFSNAKLSDDRMLAIAREMNLSETTFVFRRDLSIERVRGVRVRIFTTREELPFAGHPTLGTAATIRHAYPEYAEAETIVLDLNAGPIPVRFPREAAKTSAVTFGEMTQLDPEFGATHEARKIAPLLGLSADDIAEPAPQTVSTGIPFCIVVLRSLEGLARLQLNPAASGNYLRGSGAKFFYVLAPEESGTWRARMQFYGGEDPATGSAAGCAISYLVRHHLCVAEAQLHIRQGIEIKRPSDLYVSANFVDGKVCDVRVSGSTVPVAKGRLFLE